MVYADTDDFENLVENEGNFEDDVIEAALEAASRFADSYLGSRFTLPLTAHGADLTEKVCEIARYKLYVKKGFDPEEADAEQLRLAYEDAVKWLEMVAKGTVTPIDVVDSGGADTTDGTEMPSTARFTWQNQAADGTNESFTEQPDVTGAMGGGIGAPRRRGWE